MCNRIQSCKNLRQIKEVCWFRCQLASQQLNYYYYFFWHVLNYFCLLLQYLSRSCFFFFLSMNRSKKELCMNCGIRVTHRVSRFQFHFYGEKWISVEQFPALLLNLSSFQSLIDWSYVMLILHSFPHLYPLVFFSFIFVDELTFLT